jgi:hypothetical protein
MEKLYLLTVVDEGAANVDAWLEAVSATVLDRRRRAAVSARSG